MKEIIAIVRPGRTRYTKGKLADHEFMAYTESRVSGRGRQMGLRYVSENSDSQEAAISFLTKKMLTIFVNNDKVEACLKILVEANKTGEIGDGKIFVCPVEDVIRIRTDETKHAALV